MDCQLVPSTIIQEKYLLHVFMVLRTNSSETDSRDTCIAFPLRQCDSTGEWKTESARNLKNTGKKCSRRVSKNVDDWLSYFFNEIYSYDEES